MPAVPTDTVTVATADVDEARLAVGGIFCPHRLSPLRGAPLRLRLRAHRLESIGLVTLDYGGPVDIDPGALDSFYLVQRPLGGRARIRHGDREFISSSATASVLSPDVPVRMQWGAGNPHSIFYVSRTAVEQELRRLLGRPVTRPVVFEPGMPTHDPAVRAWLRAVAFLQHEVEGDNPFLTDPRQRSAVEAMLVGQLLNAQPHSYSAQLAVGGPVATRVVRRAMELLDAHHAEPLTVADVAEAVGVSVRSLQEGFRRDLGVSPTAYLRDRRLAAARRHLEIADPAITSVTSVALVHGFAHLGRFAADYRKAFGESPSQTLARG